MTSQTRDPYASLSRLDTTTPHPARRYNYWLGGKDNFATDRASGDTIAEEFPQVLCGAKENRRFMLRAAANLTRDRGIRQFLDIGTGIPASRNLHEVVQEIAPESRIVCVDNDDVVMVHNRSLLVSSPEGVVECIKEDLRNPDAILKNPRLEATLDFNEPIALMLVAVLHFLTDDEDPYGCVSRLIDGMPAGSFVVLSHVDESAARFNTGTVASLHGGFRARTAPEVSSFVDRLEPIGPGLASIVEWFPDDEPQPEASAEETCMYGVVARMP
jgi:S-adenosyl methyltransferase